MGPQGRRRSMRKAVVRLKHWFQILYAPTCEKEIRTAMRHHMR